MASIIGKIMGNSPWKESLCGCFNDLPICLVSWCLPCVQYGINQQELDSGQDCFLHGLIYYLSVQFGVCCIFHMGRRRALREKYGLAEDGNDCLVTAFCPLCAISQEAREIKSHMMFPAKSNMV